MAWWGVVSAVLSPALLFAGWTVTAELQPMHFDAVQRSISTLAAEGTPYRWVITLALLGVGVCNALTGCALEAAAERGRILLIAGGVSTMLIAAFPQPTHGGSLPHELFSAVDVVVMTLWPLAAVRPEPWTAFGLRRTAAVGVFVVNLAILGWFTVELFNGPLLGAAERTVTGYQAVWPLIVVVSVLLARQRAAEPAGQRAAVRSR